MDVLKVENICKHYPQFDLKNVSFNLESGTIMGFIGRNGAGKTTTLKSIMNIIHIDQGNVEIFGQNVLENANAIKQQVGFALSGIDFFPAKTLKDISNVYGKFYDNFDIEKYYKYLKAFSLDEKKKLSELSAGMKTKFLLALSLSHDAKLLILDEPTSGLDPISREEILDIFLKIIQKENRAILFSTHITSDLDKVANKITYIKNGEIKLSENKHDLLKKYKVIEGPVSLHETYKNDCISSKEYLDTFKGLIDANHNIDDKDIKVEDPTIDDIFVFLEMEGYNNEEFSL